MKPAQMTELLLQQQVEMDAVVCYNDQIALEVIRSLQKNGKRVPEDISVTGYDNSVIAEGTVGLTTIAHPQEKLGEMAAELLLEKIRKVPEDKSRIPRLIQPELIVRGSTKSRNTENK